ncbi:MAG: helix-turn-helix transcriptional regulator [Lachnospiraceae bacterium]|nr:helix-turn-helix transcriptional regulator [Lachnospiraceae bacterium]
MQDMNYNECKQRGTSDFPIDYHYVDISHPQYEMAFHWHIEYELIHIIEGSFAIQLDGKERLLKQGDLCFLTDGILHGGIPDNCVYECIVFDSGMLRNRNFAYDTTVRKIVHHQILPYQYYDYEALKESHCSNPMNLFTVADSIFTAMREKKEGYRLVTASSLLLFLGLIEQNGFYVTDATISSRNHKRTEQLKSALELIETSYHEPLTLADLSKSVGMSPKYFCRFFQQMTHRTPIDYLNYYRIERACYQLSSGEYSLMEVAYNCGFTDYSYFIKTFKKYKNTTPKKWCEGL